MIFIYTVAMPFEVLDGQVLPQDEALGDSEVTHQSEETADPADPPGLRRFNLLTGEVERRRTGWGFRAEGEGWIRAKLLRVGGSRAG